MTRPYLALRQRDFRRLWLAQLVSLTGSQMQVVAINWHIYLITRSALALGFVGLTRVLPIIFFSLWGGLLADRRDRRRVMLAAQQVLRVGPQGYGWLVAAPALGAFVGSLYTTAWPLPRAQGRVLLWCVGAYGFATVVYGLSRSYTLALLALAATGLADLVSTVIRQTLRQLITPDALRGRMTSVNMIFFMGGPQLGEMEAGLVASLFASTVTGVTVSVVSGGLLTLLVAAWVAAATPVVRAYRGESTELPSRA